jgi:hypothetical protein
MSSELNVIMIAPRGAYVRIEICSKSLRQHGDIGQAASKTDHD